jgi:hypothetical protein
MRSQMSLNTLQEHDQDRKTSSEIKKNCKGGPILQSEAIGEKFHVRSSRELDQPETWDQIADRTLELNWDRVVWRYLCSSRARVI